MRRIIAGTSLARPHRMRTTGTDSLSSMAAASSWYHQMKARSMRWDKTASCEMLSAVSTRNPSVSASSLPLVKLGAVRLKYAWVAGSMSFG